MSGPAGSTTDKRTGKRFYDCPICKGRHWSVTTVLQAVSKPWLGNWAAKMVAEGAVDATKNGSLASMVSQDADSATKFLKGLPWSTRDRAANLGTQIHKAVEAHTLGLKPPEWPLPVRPYMVEFEHFLEDYDPVFEASELSVHHCFFDYSGTLDAIAVIRGKRYLIDYKTHAPKADPGAAKPPYPEAALQLAALRKAPTAFAAGKTFPMPSIDATAVLRISPGDTELVEIETARPEVFETFLTMQAAFDWMENLSKQVILGRVVKVRTPEQLDALYERYGGSSSSDIAEGHKLIAALKQDPEA